MHFSFGFHHVSVSMGEGGESLHLQILGYKMLSVIEKSYIQNANIQTHFNTYYFVLSLNKLLYTLKRVGAPSCLI